MGEAANTDNIVDIIKDWIAWLGDPVTVTCKECDQTFTGPERANGVVCKVCPDCWYKPSNQMPGETR